jgi:hypothetical protein
MSDSNISSKSSLVTWCEGIDSPQPIALTENREGLDFVNRNTAPKNLSAGDAKYLSRKLFMSPLWGGKPHRISEVKSNWEIMIDKKRGEGIDLLPFDEMIVQLVDRDYILMVCKGNISVL